MDPGLACASPISSCSTQHWPTRKRSKLFRRVKRSCALTKAAPSRRMYGLSCTFQSIRGFHNELLLRGSYVYAILLEPACLHPCAAARQNSYGYGTFLRVLQKKMLKLGTGQTASFSSRQRGKRNDTAPTAKQHVGRCQTRKVWKTLRKRKRSQDVGSSGIMDYTKRVEARSSKPSWL